MGRVVHFELGAVDPLRAAEFYRAAFGWKINQMEGGQEYWLVSTGDPQQPGIDGGILRHKDGAPRTINSVAVDSIEDAVARINAAGGELVVPKMVIPSVGYLAYFKDTEGNLFGIFQADHSVKA